MELDTQYEVTLSVRDLMLLRAGLNAYLTAFEAHRAETVVRPIPKSRWPPCVAMLGS